MEVYLLVTESVLMFWLTDVVSYSPGHWAGMRGIELQYMKLAKLNVNLVALLRERYALNFCG